MIKGGSEDQLFVNMNEKVKWYKIIPPPPTDLNFPDLVHP